MQRIKRKRHKHTENMDAKRNSRDEIHIFHCLWGFTLFYSSSCCCCWSCICIWFIAGSRSYLPIDHSQFVRFFFTQRRSFLLSESEFTMCVFVWISHYKILMRFNDDVDGGIEWVLMHTRLLFFSFFLLSCNLLYCSVTKSIRRRSLPELQQHQQQQCQIAIDAKERKKKKKIMFVYVVGDVFVRLFFSVHNSLSAEDRFFLYARLSPRHVCTV